MNYVKNEKQDEDLELAIGFVAPSSLVTFIFRAVWKVLGEKPDCREFQQE